MHLSLVLKLPCSKDLGCGSYIKVAVGAGTMNETCQRRLNLKNAHPTLQNKSNLQLRADMPKPTTLHLKRVNPAA